MNGNAFDLAKQLQTEKIEYILSPDLRKSFSYPGIDLTFSNWQSIKYLNKNADDFHPDIINIPKDKGGLYLFYLPCEISPSITEFPLYIGRAQLTTGQNLRKRVKEYFQLYMKDDERPKVYRMLNVWGPFLRVAFFELPENNLIVDIEKDLINALLLPINDQIPDKKIRDAVKAFS